MRSVACTDQVREYFLTMMQFHTIVKVFNNANERCAH